MVSNTWNFCRKLVQFLRYIAIMSENETNACPSPVLSWVSVGLQVTKTTGTNPKLQVAHELEYRVVSSAGTADRQNLVARSRRETRGVELKNPLAEELGTVEISRQQ